MHKRILCWFWLPKMLKFQCNHCSLFFTLNLSSEHFTWSLRFRFTRFQFFLCFIFSFLFWTNVFCVINFAIYAYRNVVCTQWKITFKYSNKNKKPCNKNWMKRLKSKENGTAFKRKQQFPRVPLNVSKHSSVKKTENCDKIYGDNEEKKKLLFLINKTTREPSCPRLICPHTHIHTHWTGLELHCYPL